MLPKLVCCDLVYVAFYCFLEALPVGERVSNDICIELILRVANGALGRDRTYNSASGGPRDIHFTTRAHLCHHTNSRYQCLGAAIIKASATKYQHLSLRCLLIKRNRINYFTSKQKTAIKLYLIKINKHFATDPCPFNNL